MQRWFVRDVVVFEVMDHRVAVPVPRYLERVAPVSCPVDLGQLLGGFEPRDEVLVGAILVHVYHDGLVAREPVVQLTLLVGECRRERLAGVGGLGG